MDTQTILNEMSLIFREVLKRENIVLDNETTAQDVEGWDSLTNMQLINKIEKKFNVRFTFRDIVKLPCHFNQNQLGNVIHIPELRRTVCVYFHSIPYASFTIQKSDLTDSQLPLHRLLPPHFSDNGPHPHAYHLLPWQMDRTDQAGKQHEGNLFFRCVFSGRELVGIPVCRPAYRLPHPFSAGNLFLYFPGHFVPDRNLLARRRTGKEPARLHDIHALLHEVPFRSHRKGR